MEQGNWLMNELEAEKSLAQTKEEKEFISKLQVRLEKRLTELLKQNIFILEE